MIYFGLGVIAGYAFRGLIGHFLAKYGSQVASNSYLVAIKKFLGF
jgi:hypothetical protein